MSHESGGNRDSTHPVPDADVDADVEGEVDATAEAGHSHARPVLGDEDPTPPPARPTMSDQRKPPVLREFPPPRSVKAGRVLWLVSFVLGGAAVFISFLSGETLIAELTEVLSRLAPRYDAGEVTALVDVIYWSCLGGLGLIIAIEAIILAMLLNRRGGTRWVQLPVLVIHAGAVLVGSAFLAIGDWGDLIALLLVAGLLLAFAGWVSTLFPGAHRWFRMKDQTELVALD